MATVLLEYMTQQNKKNNDIVTCMCDYRRGLDWWLDLLTTLPHVSKLQATTAPSLISPLHKSLEHTLSLLSLLSLVVSW
jgi:hypothetical protein